MNKYLFTELRLTFWARHGFHYLARKLKRKGIGTKPYSLCAMPNDFIGREIAVRGIYEEAGIAAAEWLCDQEIIAHPQNSVFLDVGANVGVYSIALAHRFASILAFEPHPIIAQILKLNVRINNFNNVKVFQYGLSDSDKEAQLSEGGTDNLGGSSIERSIGEGKQHGILLKHGDSCIDRDAEFAVSFIKIDVEGHESSVICGLASLIKRQHPVIAFEANDPEHNQDLMLQLEELGYKLFLALDYKHSTSIVWLQVAMNTILGVHSHLKPVTSLKNKKYSLVFALPASAAERWDKVVK